MRRLNVSVSILGVTVNVTYSTSAGIDRHAQHERCNRNGMAVNNGSGANGRFRARRSAKPRQGQATGA